MRSAQVHCAIIGTAVAIATAACYTAAGSAPEEKPISGAIRRGNCDVRAPRSKWSVALDRDLRGTRACSVDGDAVDLPIDAMMSAIQERHDHKRCIKARYLRTDQPDLTGLDLSMKVGNDEEVFIGNIAYAHGYLVLLLSGNAGIDVMCVDAETASHTITLTTVHIVRP